jgi:hypothetical protein
LSNWKKLVASGSHAHLQSVTASNGSIVSGSLIMSGSINNVDNLNFYTTSSAAGAVGRFVWNDGDGTLDLGLKGGNVTLQLGQEQVARVYNAEATTLNDGEIVYISGSQGNRISVKRAGNSAEAGSRNTIGMITETILAGTEGFVTTNGVVNGLNTIGLTAGATLYLSTNGGYTQTKPVAPAHTVIVGFVQRVHASVGSIFVKIDNGYELDELHNVIDTSTTSSYGDLLVRSGSLWTNSKQLTGSYGITGSLQATSFTGSLQGTATTASYVLNSVSSSFATTASYVQNVPAPNIINNASIGRILLSDGTTNAATASSNLSWNSGNETLDVTNGGIDQIGIYTSTFAGSVVINGSLTATSSKAVSSSFASTASFLSGTVTSASFASTASFLSGTVTSASFASTASFVNTLTQNVTVSGSIFLSGSLNTPVFIDYEERFSTPGISIAPSPGELILNLANGNVFNVALNANITTLTISNPPASNNAGSFVLIFTADGIARVVSWGASILWPGGIAPTLTSTNGKKDVFGFISLNTGSNWYGFIGGQNI